jgi:eukaryotic-like serine/threonine-protein kinase
MIGETISHYRIVGKLGAGGMGEVYRATDTRLGRDVAVKVLPETFASDPKFRERFEREARAISSLQHPNICVLHDIGHVDGVDFLVLEYLEGETLDARLRKGSLPIEQVLRYGAQIADALDKAHRQGITHRDLKPANMMLTKSGVKLLDFGLAKPMKVPVTAALSSMVHTPTASLEQAAITSEGTLVGTFQYMSPEQLEGKEADARSDIFALGCVLYEMTMGKRAFDGKTTASIVAAILASEPKAITAIHPAYPPALDRVVKTCLAKDPDERWQSAHDLKRELEWISQAAGEAVLWPVRTGGWRFGMLVAGVLLTTVVAVVTGIVILNRQSRPSQQPLTRFSLTLPAGQRVPLLTWPALAVSSDGTEAVYTGGRGDSRQFYLRSMDRFEVTPLEGTENANSPFFSPDGRWLGFFAEGKLKKISLRGGLPITLCDVADDRGASWSSDDTIIYVPNVTTGLMRIPASGGTPQPLTSPDTAKGERTHRWPEVLPGGKAVVFTIGGLDSPDYFLDSKIAVKSLETGEIKILPVEGTFARYGPPGYLVFAQRGGLFAVRFDLKRLQVTGAPMRVLEDISMDPSTGAVHFSLSTRSLTYVPGGWSYSDLVLAWVDREGSVKQLPAPPRAYLNPHLSPDGKQVAFSDQMTRNAGIWLYDIARGSMMRLTYSSADTSPLWTPDGKRLVYMEEANRSFLIKSKPANGSGAEETLLAGQKYVQVPESWSPDGKFLAYSANAQNTVRNIWILPFEGDRKPQPFIQSVFTNRTPRFSPDGHWIAYVSDESGRYEVYVQPFPGPGGKWQVSTDGGNWPVWARNGRELFYLNGSKIMRVAVTTRPSFAAATPQIVADTPIQTSDYYGGNGEFDVSLDGRQFLFMKSREQNTLPAEVRVVLNWAEELKRPASQASNP